MAIMKSQTGREVELLTEHLVGRSSRAQTQLADPKVSGQHASIRWVGTGWQLRDLGSRNGTWIDGQRAPADTSVPLAVGSSIWFGDVAHTYVLVDATPPSPHARSASDLVRGDAHLLALPSEDDPKAVVSFESQGWILSTDDDARVVTDGEQVEVDGVSYVLSLPEPIARTVDASPMTRAGPSLAFSVSADEEYVELTVDTGGQSHRLAPRAHQYTLLVLARARLDDAASGVPEGEQGWVYTAELAKQLRVTMNRLYVTLHRCRKELDGVQVGAGATVIEKRVTTRQVRLAWPRLVVESL